MREEMVKVVSDYVDTNKNSCLLFADTGAYAFRDVQKKNPDRVLDIGIMEDGLVGVAAGMSLNGMNPIIYAMTPFIIERAFEQIKLDFVYQKMRGNIITLGAAYDFSMLGYSHFCAEDYSLLRNLNEVEFIAPGRGDELAALFSQCVDNEKLTFYRLSDYPNKNGYDVEFGKAKVLKRGNRGTVIVVGTMLDVTIAATEDEDVTVLYYTTLAPFDKETLINNCTNKKILLCEPHFSGSLDPEIIACFPGEYISIDHVGLPLEVFRNYGKKIEKDRYYGLTVENIKDHLKELQEGRKNV